MTGTTWAVIVAAASWTVLVLVTCVVLVRVARLLDTVTASLGEVADQATTAVAGLNETVAGVNVELARVDTIVAGVQSITATTDQLVRLARTTLGSPLIKGAAAAAGTVTAARSLRGGR